MYCTYDCLSKKIKLPKTQWNGFYMRKVLGKEEYFYKIEKL